MYYLITDKPRAFTITFRLGIYVIGWGIILATLQSVATGELID